jgi:2-C-methyl-D-erythritol 4-phosphate cytidylyltransferase
LAAAGEHGAAIAAVPVTDTLKRVRSSLIVQTIDREDLWAAQTPQCFLIDLLRRAFAYAEESGLKVTDDAALVEALGLPVAIVPGSAANLKITRRQDLDVAEALMSEQRAR